MEIPSYDAGVVKEMKSRWATRSTRVGAAVLEANAAAPGPRRPRCNARTRAGRFRTRAGSRRGRRLVDSPCRTIAISPTGVIELLVRVGDTVRRAEPDHLESDKASMEIPSSHRPASSGTEVKIGARVSKAADACCSRRRRPRPAPAPAPAASGPGPCAAAAARAGGAERPCDRRAAAAHPTAPPLNLRMPRRRSASRAELGVPLEEVKAAAARAHHAVRPRDLRQV